MSAHGHLMQRLAVNPTGDLLKMCLYFPHVWRPNETITVDVIFKKFEGITLS